MRYLSKDQTDTMKISPTDQLMTQMRLMAAQARGAAQAEVAAMPAGSGNFVGMLQDALGQVNKLQETSNDMAGSFERGESRYSLAEVMIAKQKASIAFQATVQVRNKLLESYKEVMSMSI